MSMDFYYYVGPYIQAFSHYEKKEVERVGCRKCESNYITSKFCPNCGDVIKKYRLLSLEKSTKHINIYDLIGDQLTSTGEISFKDFDVYMPNNKYSERELRIEDVNIQAINNSDIKKEIVWFENKYKEEIEKLKEPYDKIEIKWGVVRSFY